MTLYVKPHPIHTGIYLIPLENGNHSLATVNLTPGSSVYGERLHQIDQQEYRLWNPYHSKLAAAVLRNLGYFPIQVRYKILYLGAASGTTVSHISDIVGLHGGIYAIEFSPRPLRELISKVASQRTNVYPILADARRPGNYRFLLESVDCIYCDIAQPQQAKILFDNARYFLKPGNYVVFAIKGRSIKSTGKLDQIFQNEIAYLRSRDFSIEQTIDLEPYHSAHLMVVARYRSS
jgi:fibrillarin-like pre-rRNA processing protein